MMTPEKTDTNTSSRRIDHIAIAVRDIDDTLPLYKLLGFQLREVVEVESEEVRVAKLEAENVTIELLEPITESSTVQKFLETNGPGLHHICLDAQELDDTLSRLKQEGIEPVYESSRPGAENQNINFLHPDDTNGVLIELQQTKPSNPSNK